MLLNLLLRTWRHHWTTLLIWTGFCLLEGIYNLALYPYFNSLPEYSSYLAALPPWVLFIESLPAHLTGDAAFLFLTTFGFTAPCAWLVLAIRVGLKETAGEEESGSIIFLLPHPIQRWNLYLAKALAISILIVVMGVLFWASMNAVATLAKINVSIDWLAWSTLNLGLFVLWCSAVAMLLGSFFSRVDLPALLVGLIILVMWAVQGLTHLNSISPGVSWFNPWSLVIMTMVEKNLITPWVWGVMTCLIILSFAGGMASWQLKNFYSLTE